MLKDFEIESMLWCVWSVIDHRRCQIVARTSVTHLAITSCATYLFLPHFDIICDHLWSSREHRINLLNRNMGGSLGEQEMLWEHEPWASVSTALSSSPKLSRVLLHVYLNRNTENMFSMSFTCRKHCDRKRETTCLLWSSKCKFSLLTPSLRQQLMLVLCFYQVIETQF